MKMQDKWMFNECENGLWCGDDFETKEEAIEASKEYLSDEQTEMFVGQCDIVPLPLYVDVEDVFERLNEMYSEECFEHDGDLFEDVKKEDYEWLENEFKKVMNKFYKRTKIKSTNFTIKNIQRIIK